MKCKILNKLNNLPLGLRASIAYFFASVVTVGISYIITPLYTRMLSTEEYGQVSVFLTWVQIFGIVAMFCLSYGVFNNGMLDYSDRRDDYSFSMLVLSNIITVVVFIIVLLVYPMIKPLIGLDIPLIVLMFISFLFQPAYNFWVARQRYEYKYKTMMIWAIVSAVFSTVVTVISILLFDKGERLYPRIFGTEITLIIIYIGFYVYLGIKNKWKVTPMYWKGALLFNLPLIPHYLSTYLLGSSDKVMISYLVSDTATAYYSVAYSVASVVTIIWSAINGTLLPFTYEKCKEENYKAINDVTLPILLLLAVCCVILIMLAPEVVWIMAAKEYSEAVYAIPPIVGGVFFQMQYYVYANIVYYYKKPKYVMAGSVSAMLLNIILNYIFIGKYGYIAAGYTTLFCYLLQALIDYVAMRHVVGKDVYNMGFIFTLSCSVIAIALLSNFVYHLTFVRYVVLFIIFIFTIIFRKRIINLFCMMKQ